MGSSRRGETQTVCTHAFSYTVCAHKGGVHDDADIRDRAAVGVGGTPSLATPIETIEAGA